MALGKVEGTIKKLTFKQIACYNTTVDLGEEKNIISIYSSIAAWVSGDRETPRIQVTFYGSKNGIEFEQIYTNRYSMESRQVFGATNILINKKYRYMKTVINSNISTPTNLYLNYLIQECNIIYVN